MAVVSVEDQLLALTTSSSAQLRDQWVALTASPIPRISPAMLRLALAWEIQARALGGLSRETVRQLDQLAAAKTRTSPAQAGMRLVRAWGGKIHVVTIGDDKVILERASMGLAERGRARDHRHALVGAGVLRAQAQGDPMKTIRCAIYTRKSSEEGLEQAFNSLDAQREACAAYILSQASEGWSALPDMYDDGGLSGGSLERPALQRLLGEVTAGRVDIIVVYKVDRLTRSLLDFSKLVEAFDKAGTSFVSVTQSFNTTTSMGRLTLNMLLSFAQFEREVTAERIRDKIAASKAKGMWMGGTPQIGYCPDGRTLAIVDADAALVRSVFGRYLATGNVRLVKEQLDEAKITTPKRYRVGSGAAYGGIALSRGQIYTMLRCAVYIGEIHHGGAVYPGLHRPIIDRDIWDRAQTMLAGNLQGQGRTHRPRPNLLAGKLVDAEGKSLVAVHATKGNQRYRYYVSRNTQHAGQPGIRIPAGEVEGAVCTGVADALGDALGLAATAWLDVAPSDVARYADRCAEAARLAVARNAQAIGALVRQVRIHDGHIEVECATEPLALLLKVERHPDGPSTITLPLPIRLTRTGHAMRLIQHSGAGATAQPNASVIKLLIKARSWWAQLRTGEIDVTGLAKREGVVTSYVSRVVRLAFLAPAVTDAIIAGTTLSSVDVAALTVPGAFPELWSEQMRMILPMAKLGSQRHQRLLL